MRTFSVGCIEAEKFRNTFYSSFLTVLKVRIFTYLLKSQGKLQLEINIYKVWNSACTGQLKKVKKIYFCCLWSWDPVDNFIYTHISILWLEEGFCIFIASAFLLQKQMWSWNKANIYFESGFGIQGAIEDFWCMIFSNSVVGYL